jgi:hypothetical protein
MPMTLLQAAAMLKRYGVDVEHATSHASVGEDPLAWACVAAIARLGGSRKVS